MDDIIVRTETTLDDLQNRLNANEGFTNITESDIYGIASELAKMIFKNVPALKVIDALSTLVKVDSKLILEKIRYMVDNNYTVFVTVATYEYAGYMPGSSYPTYTIKSVEYHYE